MNSWLIEDERQNESKYVLDASALLALILREPGQQLVASAVLEGACISAVNLAEVASRLNDLGFTPEDADDAMHVMAVQVVDFPEEMALMSGELREPTRQLGLGLGDRACLALTSFLEVPVLTCDSVWQRLDIGVEVVLCR